MNYDGRSSRPQIERLIKVHDALLSIGLEPFWTADGVECRRVIASHTPPILLVHSFAAEPARLKVLSTVERPTIPDSKVQDVREQFVPDDINEPLLLSVDANRRLTGLYVSEVIGKSLTNPIVIDLEQRITAGMIDTVERIGLAKPTDQP